jgi:hypothetical protein
VRACSGELACPREDHRQHGVGRALRAVSWQPQAPVGVREWIRVGKRFGAIARGSQWWIGDWLRYGLVQWGEKYVEAARITGYDVGTLRNIAWIAASSTYHYVVTNLAGVTMPFWRPLATRKRGTGSRGLLRTACRWRTFVSSYGPASEKMSCSRGLGLPGRTASLRSTVHTAVTRSTFSS